LKEYDSTTIEALSQNILVVDDDKTLSNSFKTNNNPRDRLSNRVNPT